MSQTCERQQDCDDGRYCNGLERCEPGAAGAGPDGCMAAVPACGEGTVCDEDTDRCDACTAENRDRDGDSEWSEACGGNDCNDDDPDIRPAAAEVCDPAGIDEDCRPATLGPPGPTGVLGDADGDSFASARCCQIQLGGALACGNDCDDTNGEINPDASEICNGVDDNCDGMLDPTIEDRDGDGWAGCTDLPAELRDCDDASSATYPGAPELCDGEDNDCDGSAAGEDLDSDGHLATDATCAGGPRSTLPRTDCNDGDATVSPVAMERCDSIDHDCDGTTDETPAAESCPSDSITSYDCSAETCVVASCAATHDDCDGLDANGCEQPLNVREHCAACGNACQWTCETGPACDDPVAFSAGAFHVCARTSSGSIRCWGRNDLGQLGSGGLSPTPSTRPADYVQAQTTAGVVALTTVQELESGAHFNCARVTSRNLYCWGRNDHGQLGDGISGASSGIARTLVSGVDSFAIGETHVCAIRSGGAVPTGSVWCWGDGRSAQCGASRLAGSVAPQQAWASTSAVQVVAGAEHSCLLTGSGEVWCWGGNTQGQCADGTTGSPIGNPRRVRNEGGTGFLTGIVEIGSGSYVTCARASTGRTVCWGAGAPLPRAVRMSTSDTTLVSFTSFVGQGNYFGNGVVGQTATGPRTAEPRTASASTIFVGTPVSIAMGSLRDLGGSLGTVGEMNSLGCLLHDPGLQCLGFNSYGEVGNGTRSPVTPPPATVLPP